MWILKEIMFLPISVLLLPWLGSDRCFGTLDLEGAASYDKVIGLANQGLIMMKKDTEENFIRLVKKTAKG